MVTLEFKTIKLLELQIVQGRFSVYQKPWNNQFKSIYSKINLSSILPVMGFALNLLLAYVIRLLILTVFAYGDTMDDDLPSLFEWQVPFWSEIIAQDLNKMIKTFFYIPDLNDYCAINTMIKRVHTMFIP